MNNPFRLDFGAKQKLYTSRQEEGRILDTFFADKNGRVTKWLHIAFG